MVDDDNVADKNESKNFEFGVELASVSNYAVNSTNNSLSVGGGFSAAYRVAKNISLATGMVISKQDLSYDGSGSNKFFSNGLDYVSGPQSNLAGENSLNMIDGRTTESNISFVAIDIPMNIEFRHKKMVFSAGFSSLIFVNEKYSYNYNIVVNSMNYNDAKATYESTSNTLKINSAQTNETFNHIDFAGLFNLSVAYDVPLPKGSIAFEPYIKLPLADISSRDVRMGSGGLTLRYNF
jgi:hypothetical protein